MKNFFAVILTAICIAAWGFVLSPNGKQFVLGAEVQPFAENSFECGQAADAPTPTIEALDRSVSAAVEPLTFQLMGSPADNCGSVSSCGTTGCKRIMGGSQYVYPNGIKNCKSNSHPQCYNVVCLVRTFATTNCSGEFIDESRVDRRGCKKQLVLPVPTPAPEV